jgi:hypothetical protein
MLPACWGLRSAEQEAPGISEGFRRAGNRKSRRLTQLGTLTVIKILERGLSLYPGEGERPKEADARCSN